MTNKLKNKRGFSLVELMVVVAIMGTLASIAIPAFNEYRKSAKRAGYKSDLNSLHRSWLAFGVELDSYCERESGSALERVANLENIGMASIINSKLYGSNPGKANFIGFGREGCTGTSLVAAAPNVHVVRDVSATTDADCTLNVTTYKMGVFGHISGNNWFGIQVDQDGLLANESDTLTKTDFGDVCT